MIELKTARYKGVEFLFTDMPTTGGNRLIKYNFPGSDKQAIERQGKAPRTFTLTAIIPDEDYYAQRDNLLRVLEDGAPGVLTHPTFGDVENVINGEYTLTERLTALGRAEIVIPFEVDDTPGVPLQSDDLAAQTQTLSDATNAQLVSDVSEGFTVSLNFSGNFTDALESVANVAEAFRQASEFSTPISDNIASFRASIVSIASSAGDLIQSPSELAAQIDGLFADLNNLYDSITTTRNVFLSMFGFGDDDEEIIPTTVGLEQRSTNRGLIRTIMQTEALSYAYLNAVQVEYLTTDDLDAVQVVLEDQYLKIREAQDISNASLEQLDRLRVQTLKALDAVRVNTRSVITIETALKPLAVLVYEYYGSTDLVETIAELNNVKQHAFVSGELRILTA